METATKNKLTIKSLIGLAKLTVDQVTKYLDHPNYQLKGSQVVLVDNFNVIYGASDEFLEGYLVKIGQSKRVYASNWSRFLEEDMFLIIFKEGKPTYIVF